MTTVSPTSRSLDRLRRQGFMASVVEKRIPSGSRSITRDLFGFADILAVRSGEPTLAVQTTTASNFSARCRKVRNSYGALCCARAGWSIEVHGWRKLKTTGKWEPLIMFFGPETFPTNLEDDEEEEE